MLWWLIVFSMGGCAILILVAIIVSGRADNAMSSVNIPIVRFDTNVAPSDASDMIMTTLGEEYASELVDSLIYQLEIQPNEEP